MEIDNFLQEEKFSSIINYILKRSRHIYSMHRPMYCENDEALLGLTYRFRQQHKSCLLQPSNKEVYCNNRKFPSDDI
jgi:hypothetical protein